MRIVQSSSIQNTLSKFEYLKPLPTKLVTTQSDMTMALIDTVLACVKILTNSETIHILRHLLQELWTKSGLGSPSLRMNDQSQSIIDLNNALIADWFHKSKQHFYVSLKTRLVSSSYVCIFNFVSKKNLYLNCVWDASHDTSQLCCIF